ncbi:MAG: DEAD/DEAH box helicase [Elusimicrobiota bacterium]|nr:DEAD/DEAH box helicase [Elusimicrobiota bacterium]
MIEGNFKDLGINDELVEILKKKGFERPTPIQSKTIPLILEGKDMIGQAETGSGKTAACAIPLVQQIDKSINDIQTLVLTPTRELAIQYLDEVSSFATPYGVTPFVIYGGFNKDIHLAKLRSGVQILVATPGRLIDIIYNHYLALENLKTMVIDEADEMLKMGFIEDVDFIKSCIVQKHQTLLFSATMPDPIKRLASKYMKGATHIKLNADQTVPSSLVHYVIRAEGRSKDAALGGLLSNKEVTQTIIFCNTRNRVKSLFKAVSGKFKGTDYLHGGMEQNLRTRIMEKFRAKKIKFLITTDVMARGIDVRGVSHIINYDFPKNSEIYVHRTGRTARLGKKGTAVSLITRSDSDTYSEVKEKYGINSAPFPGIHEKHKVPRGKRPRGHSIRKNN